MTLCFIILFTLILSCNGISQTNSFKGGSLNLSENLIIHSFPAANSNQGTQAKDKSCSPLVGILIGYTNQRFFGSGISVELSAVYPNKKCTDCTGFGTLCYLIGSTTGIKTKYFPSKMFDISPYYGYKNWSILPFGKIQIDAGYSFVPKKIGDDFIHLDPSISFDLLLFYISFGHSFRSTRFDNKIDAPFFNVAISPSILFRHSRIKNNLSNYFKASKSNRKMQFQSL